MRKVVARLLISLDGVVESPSTWKFEHFDDDMLTDLRAQLSEEDVMLLGRKTYEEWEPYWPTSTYEPFASHINHVPKFVASTTLSEVRWGERDNAMLKKDFGEAVQELKRQPGKNIGVHGSPTLAQSMFYSGFLDELRLAVYPVVAGRGKRFFRDEADLKRLKLVDSKMTRTGAALLTYQPL